MFSKATRIVTLAAKWLTSSSDKATQYRASHWSGWRLICKFSILLQWIGIGIGIPGHPRIQMTPIKISIIHLPDSDISNHLLCCPLSEGGWANILMKLIIVRPQNTYLHAGEMRNLGPKSKNVVLKSSYNCSNKRKK